MWILVQDSERCGMKKVCVSTDCMWGFNVGLASSLLKMLEEEGMCG